LIEIPIRFDSRVPIQHFSINGIKLRKGENKEIGSYLQEMFNKPAKFLLEPPGEDWRNLNVYKNYFQKYDSNYISGTNDVESADEGDSDPNQEPTERNFNDYTKINFPLPATIDLEVDLREGQRKLRVLGLDFGFDKLDKGLKSWILNFRNSDEKSGVKNPLD